MARRSGKGGDRCLEEIPFSRQGNALNLGLNQTLVEDVMELAPMHWVVVAVVALLLFGPKKLPELGKGIGEGIKNFKEGLKQGTDTTAAKTEAPVTSQNPQA
jgi:sec-independent protein translocase protein TatA